MTELDKIIVKIEQFAAPELACDWDNSGWQVFLGNMQVNRALLAITITDDILEQAIANDCNLIIAHHPLIFEKINKISTQDAVSALLVKAIHNNIQIYSAHTNLDSCKGGVADVFAKLLGLNNIKVLDKETGLGRIGEFENEKDVIKFICELKEILNIQNIKIINTSNIISVKKVAVIPGSGASYIKNIKDIDVLITGDVKYHDALDAKNFAVIDAGHFETERPVLNHIKQLLSHLDLEILIAKEKSPWEFL